MKNITTLLLCFLLCTQTSFAQADYSGNWQGAIELPGTKLELSIHLQQESGQWKGFLSIPVQQIKDMALAELQITGSEMKFKLPEVPANASFSGNFDEKADQLAGTFRQAGQAFPMNLTRASAAAKAAEAKRLAEAVATLRQLTDSLMQKRHTPGLAFGVVYEGKIILNEGFGYRDLEKKLPVTPNTLFAIGSSSKAFTTAGLAILADKSQLDWEKPVVQYMPDFQLYDDFSTREMTATDLTCHRSGLPRHDMIWYGSSFTRQEIYERLRYLKPNKSLRTHWQYNNLMFMTAGCLIERISGQTWEAFTQEHIFKPLGMNSSNFSVKDMAKSKDAALGYETKDKKNTKLPYRDIDAMGPAGSINSNTNDMLKWVQLHLNHGKSGEKQLVSAAEIAHLHRPQMLMDEAGLASSTELSDLSYALGWIVHRHRGLRVIEHGGNIDGFSALVYMVPERDFGLVILSNQNSAGIPTVMARYATDLILGLEKTDWYARNYGDDGQKEETPEGDKKPEPRRVPNTQPSHSLADYAGEYAHKGYGILEVQASGEGMKLRFNSFELPLEHWHYDVFRAQDTTLDISFMLNFQNDANGNIYQLSTILDPSLPEEVFSKTAPARLSDPAFLKKLTGKYTLEGPGENLCTFELRSNTLYAKLAGQPEYTLVPFQGTEFKLKDLNGYSLEFVLNEKGEAVSANFIQPEGVFKAKKAD